MTLPRCTKIKAVAIYIPHGVVLIVLLTFNIVAADRNIGVTALAPRHKIFIVVCAAVCKRKDVVHFLCGRQAAMLYNKARGICLVVIRFVFHQASLGSAVYHQARK